MEDPAYLSHSQLLAACSPDPQDAHFMWGSLGASAEIQGDRQAGVSQRPACQQAVIDPLEDHSVSLMELRHHLQP
ncbi:hypothetical protein WJX73_010145 [Symbiochloris irregularis]|uniref:Uncharacterized protein n=1 Tax=Symbiochloris irregularis TaxID=706552 RepID=A0AAW1PGB6_9CHLO